MLAQLADYSCTRKSNLWEIVKERQRLRRVNTTESTPLHIHLSSGGWSTHRDFTHMLLTHRVRAPPPGNRKVARLKELRDHKFPPPFLSLYLMARSTWLSCRVMFCVTKSP